MIRRLFALAFLILVSSPFSTRAYAQTTPGACTKLTVPTAQAAATAAATKAANTAPTATIPAASIGGKGSGSIALSGAFALYPLAQVWGEAYNKLHGDVNFDIQAGGAGKGMTDVLSGAADIALLSRDVRPEETSKGAVLFPAAIDAVVFTINAQNPVARQISANGLPCATLAKIFLGGEKLTWGQIAGTDDKSPINIYTRADSSGAAEQASKYLGGNTQDDLKGIGVQGDPGVLEAVRKDPLGIGYNNIGFAYDPSTKVPIEGVIVVPLDQDGSGKIEAAEAIYTTQKDITTAIAGKKYPSPPARALYLVTKGQPQGAVRDFIKWALTDGQQFVEDAGYVKIAQDKLQAALDTLK